jgi:hypothetical protein
MPELLQRILIFILGVLLFAGSWFLFSRSKSVYEWVENYRDRFPVTRVINPLARLNSPTASRISAIWIAFVMFLMSVLLIVVSIFGQKEP